MTSTCNIMPQNSCIIDLSQDGNLCFYSWSDLKNHLAPKNSQWKAVSVSDLCVQHSRKTHDWKRAESHRETLAGVIHYSLIFKRGRHSFLRSKTFRWGTTSAQYTHLRSFCFQRAYTVHSNVRSLRTRSLMHVRQPTFIHPVLFYDVLPMFCFTVLYSLCVIIWSMRVHRTLYLLKKWEIKLWDIPQWCYFTSPAQFYLTFLVVVTYMWESKTSCLDKQVVILSCAAANYDRVHEDSVMTKCKM